MKPSKTRIERANLPHARGDEPDNAMSLLGDVMICPTHVGMNRPYRRDDRVYRRICPTHVGMNRTFMDYDGEMSESAPRTWG